MLIIVKHSVELSLTHKYAVLDAKRIQIRRVVPINQTEPCIILTLSDELTDRSVEIRCQKSCPFLIVRNQRQGLSTQKRTLRNRRRLLFGIFFMVRERFDSFSKNCPHPKTQTRSNAVHQTETDHS